MASSDPEPLDALGMDQRAPIVLSGLASLDHDELTLKLQQVRFKARPTDPYQTTPAGDVLSYKDALDALASARKQIMLENADVMPRVREMVAKRDAAPR